MSLNNPDSRRALRNVLLFIVVLALLGTIYWATYLLSKDLLGIREIARGSLIIVGLFVLGVIAENVGRVSVDIAGAKANMGDGNGS
jgi:hypothetical protein